MDSAHRAASLWMCLVMFGYVPLLWTAPLVLLHCECVWLCLVVMFGYVPLLWTAPLVLLHCECVRLCLVMFHCYRQRPRAASLGSPVAVSQTMIIFISYWSPSVALWRRVHSASISCVQLCLCKHGRKIDMTRKWRSASVTGRAVKRLRTLKNANGKIATPSN